MATMFSLDKFYEKMEYEREAHADFELYYLMKAAYYYEQADDCEVSPFWIILCQLSEEYYEGDIYSREEYIRQLEYQLKVYMGEIYADDHDRFDFQEALKYLGYYLLNK